MQHHIRDPNRDQEHGRVYRVTYPSRPLVKAPQIAGAPIPALLELLKSPEDRVRYRTRIELSNRDSQEVLAATEKWLASLDAGHPDHEHHVLEGLWLHQQHNVVNEALLRRVLNSKDHRARAAATSFQITPEVLNNPEAFNKFQQVQGELSGALSRLMAVSEKYPDLKANENFRDLQSQLEGTENRITVARQRYIAAVQDYNVTVRKFPNNLTAMVFGYETKPSFTVENEKAISTAPSVDFGK